MYVRFAFKQPSGHWQEVSCSRKDQNYRYWSSSVMLHNGRKCIVQYYLLVKVKLGFCNEIDPFGFAVIKYYENEKRLFDGDSFQVWSAAPSNR
jgi:hypothetical protein